MTDPWKFLAIAMWRRKGNTAFYAALYVLVIEPECRCLKLPIWSHSKPRTSYKQLCTTL